MILFFEKCIFVLRTGLSLLVVSLCSLVLLILGTLTLFKFRRFYAERIVAPTGLLVLKIFGISLQQHGDIRAIDKQVVFISNHSSTLDIFALVALALPNTRFFLSAFLRKFIPIGIIGTIVRNFWIVSQKQPLERIEIFKRAEQTLRSTGESVYLSPEGKRVTTGEIGHFNKGSFHLATLLQIPIVPLYIHIPKQIDPGDGWQAKPGMVSVYLGETINTDGWQLDDLLTNKETIRDMYVQWHKAMNSNND